MIPEAPLDVAAARARIGAVALRDEVRLNRRLDAVVRQRDPDRRLRALSALAGEIAEAERRVARRRTSLPPISYPADLPVVVRRDRIAAAIAEHQVVVLAGETGSGKTTQLPKICLELGRGVRGTIGHTQPRRIAARSVAERIAEELGTDLGRVVGYRVRFTEAGGKDTLVRLMTDGVLLAETRSDPLLRRYDTIIIDEAHERSLTIDFLLGYLRRILPSRPDLKVVVTSATIDPGRFADHFGGAPVVEVSGRTYPVELRYRPYGPDAPATNPEEPADERDQTQAILDAVAELDAEDRANPSRPRGDILVFLSGEREIRDTADALRGADLPSTEVLPLYGRLSAAEQHRVFAPASQRRIVLATNVAETSLTVPGIRYVIDPGTARLSRYSHRTKVQRLPIEPISQASAQQRAGRCGRTADGICIRLYAEQDLLARPRYTDPEILRTNLSSVLLQMAALELGDIDSFPFLDPPDRRAVRDGIALLLELGAFVEKDGPESFGLTPVGRQMARMPLDPRLARMVLAAGEHGCVEEMLVIASALAIQDPRERPADAADAARAAHARFNDATSDFLGWLHLWNHLQDRQQDLSGNAFRRLCRSEFLHYLRVREWQDLQGQLGSVVTELGVRSTGRRPGTADPRSVHRALLTGLLSHVGMWDPVRREYVGARGLRFAIAPGTPLARKPPRWVVAGELVETSRTWARSVAAIDPAWVEPLARHLTKSILSEPRWDRRRAEAVATERVTLFGLPIVPARTVALARTDPEHARALFIRHALVEGDWDTPHAFLRANEQLLEQLEALEARARRRGLVVDKETIEAWYAERVPTSITSGRLFDRWWRQERPRAPERLTFLRSDLLRPEAERADAFDAFPETWPCGALELGLEYTYEPGSADDGVTVLLPLAVLPDLRPGQFEWQVPGLREELVVALIRALPKALRRSFVPVPTYAAAVLADLGPPTEASLHERLAAALTRLGGPRVTVADFDLERVPSHLRMALRVVDERGRTVATGRVGAPGAGVADLQRQLAPRVRADRAAAAGDLVRTGLTDWPSGLTLPRRVEVRHGTHTVPGYPSVVDEQRGPSGPHPTGQPAAGTGARTPTAGITVHTDPAAQAAAMRLGTARLLLCTTPVVGQSAVAGLDRQARLALATSPEHSVPELLEQCRTAAVLDLLDEAGGAAWDEEGFRALQARVRPAVAATTAETVRAVAAVLVAAGPVRSELTALRGAAFEEVVDDVRGQLDHLVFPGFVAATGRKQLAHLPRYLAAAQRRLQRLRTGGSQGLDRDLAQMDRIHTLEDAFVAVEQQRRETGAAPRGDPMAVRWLLEELRVSLFAQELRTPVRVSEERVRTAISALG